MGWLSVFFVLACLFFVGCSFKTLFLYVIITGLSFGLTSLFLTNKWGLDGFFEEIFKVVELFGFGVPLRLESRIAYSSLYTDGGSDTLEELPKPLEEELRKFLANIIRDFIRTWYEDVGRGDHFIAETQELLEILCIEGYKRASQIDSHYLVEQVIVIFHGHLERFNKAMAIVKAKDPKLRLSISSSQLLCQTYESQLKFERPALTSAAKELSYLRNVIDCLLAAMVPKDTFNCDTGRFILREILAVQVMSQLVQLMIDPDWICEAVIEVLKDRVSAKPQDVDVRNGSNDRGTDQCDGATNVDKEEVDDHLQSYGSVENTSSSLQSITREEVLSQERKDSLDNVGDRIEITSPEACGDSPDYPTSRPVTSSRQPPIGESQHDSAESYLVISVEENGVNSNAEQNQNGSNWSMEVVPPTSLESIGSSSLTSSWTCCSSPDDESFNAISFEEIKEKLSMEEIYGNAETALQSLEEMTCCYNVETNDEEEYPSLSLVAQRGSCDEGSDMEDALCTRFRTRSSSLSLPRTDRRKVDVEQTSSSYTELTRSISAPCTLSFTNIKKEDDEDLYISADRPSMVFGSPFYQTSFCSSSDSFKSISSDEDVVGSYIEKGEEVLEDGFDIDPFAPQTQVQLNRSRMVKQASFDEPSDRVTSDSSVDELVVQKAMLPTYSEDKGDYLDLSCNTEKSVLGNANDSNARAANEADQRISGSVFETQESEYSFGDVVLNAGKRFVSNFKPPFKFDSLSTSSNKSSDASDRESMDFTAENQSRRCPQGMLKSTANTAAAMSATSGGMRRLSRSHAILEESIESDTCYGTPKEKLDHAKIHVDDVAQDRNPMEDVKRMHPSELISIPNTVVALETTWEPGRNKYTLYKIEYDIRIWYEVHNAAIKQARSDAKKEQIKRKLYGDPIHSKEADDDELSLEKIKRRVPLKRVINRRYREFMELHNRLTNSPLGVHMKDILRPNRKYNLPFGRLDPHVVEGRRKLLQYYLGSLISKPPLRNSEDLKQFLGVTEGKKISFIKPSVAQIVTQSVHVPRVDKMLSRQMTKVIDSIKTVFDSGEEEEDLPEEPSLEGNDRTVVPWKLADQDTLKASPEAGVNQGTDLSMHCFSAFLSDCVEFSLPSSPSPLHVGKQEVFDEKDAGQLRGKKNKVMPFDMDEEASVWESYFKVSQHLGPRTAGDGSDNPDELSSMSPSNSPPFPELAKTAGSRSDESEGSAVAFKRYLDVQSRCHEYQRPVHHLAVSQSLPRSKSMEEISSEAALGKSQFRPQKIFEAAKRIGQGNKSGSMESLEIQSTEREKQHGALKKLLEESAARVFAGNPNKQKHIKEGSGENPSPVGHSLNGEEPNALSAVDTPSSIDERSFTERASDGSDLQCPLSDAILSLLCELLKDHDSWLTIDRVHQFFSATLGGLLEWCIQREIDNITSDEAWAMYLSTLIEAIWPQGKLIVDAKKTKSEMEKARTRKEAVIALMDAFPGFVKLCIGPRAYQQTAVNVIESLQYPQLNKVLLCTLLELVLSEIVPEIQDSLPFFRGIGTQK